ncbi:unnamed protein product [Oikopleura dioica]|uniref:Uncharacterized protein n=1 Tax=Oikopleura dioica TaxID=34765 RepID=E4XLD0_OIKDI|nr:unnamed protein product [Oikopleura dioica]
MAGPTSPTPPTLPRFSISPVETPTTAEEAVEAEKRNEHWWKRLNFDDQGRPRPDEEFFQRLKKRRALDLIEGVVKFNTGNYEDFKARAEEEMKKAFEYLESLEIEDFSEDDSESSKSNGQETAENDSRGKKSKEESSEAKNT